MATMARAFSLSAKFVYGIGDTLFGGPFMNHKYGF